MKVQIGAPAIISSGENLCTATASVALLADDGSVIETTEVSRSVGAGDENAVKSVSDAFSAHAYERYRQQQMVADLAKQVSALQTEAQAKVDVKVAAYDAARLVIAEPIGKVIA